MNLLLHLVIWFDLLTKSSEIEIWNQINQKCMSGHLCMYSMSILLNVVYNETNMDMCMFKVLHF